MLLRIKTRPSLNRSAEAYLVAPNGFVRLWDANKPMFYEKRADALSKKINSTHAAGDVDYDSLSDESKNLVEHTLESYRDYADKDGERRIEIESLNDNKDHNQWTIDRAISDVEDIDEAVEEAREAYAEALAEAKAAAEEGDGPIEIDFDPDELEPDYDDVIDDLMKTALETREVIRVKKDM